jgi:hypothetical protein
LGEIGSEHGDHLGLSFLSRSDSTCACVVVVGLWIAVFGPVFFKNVYSSFVILKQFIDAERALPG